MRLINFIGELYDLDDTEIDGRKDDRKAIISDFSILLGGKVSNKERTGEWRTDIDSRFKRENITKFGESFENVDFNGKTFNEYTNEDYDETIGIRPAMDYESLTSREFEYIDGKFHHNFLHDIDIKNEIKCGEYPQTIVESTLSAKLESLYLMNKLKKTGKEYRVPTTNLEQKQLVKDGKVIFEEYEYKGNKYVRVIAHNNQKDARLSNGKKVVNNFAYWVKVEPIIWKLYGLDAYENKFLVSKKILFAGATRNEALYDYLREEMEEEIKVGEEKLPSLDEINEKSKQELKKKEELRKKREEEEKLEESRKQKKEEVIKAINDLVLKIKDLEAFQINTNTDTFLSKLYHSIDVGPDLLFDKVNDHYEVNNNFIDLLEYINLSFITPKNLKLSGIDWSKTNLHYNPQYAYNKDLSNAIFIDENLFGDFSECDLRGTVLEGETFPIGIETAIIDKNTVLPKIITNRNAL